MYEPSLEQMNSIRGSLNDLVNTSASWSFDLTWSTHPQVGHLTQRTRYKFPWSSIFLKLNGSRFMCLILS